MLAVLRKFESTKAFTDAEAWALFRTAALGEAIGWTLLVMGIALEHLTGSHTYVAVAGRIHGMLFVAYMVAVLAFYPSLAWSRWKALVALALSVPPYGSLAFERWAAWRRRAHGFRTYRQYLLYNRLLLDSRSGA